MTTAVVEQGQKKVVGAGLGLLIIIGLVLWAMSRKKQGQGQGEGEPKVKIEGLTFASSPQVEKITKKQGEGFSPYLELNNTGGAGRIYIKSRFGWDRWYGFDEEGSMPVLDQSLDVAEGKKTYTLVRRVVWADAKISLYDVYVGLSLKSGGTDMDYKVFTGEFEVVTAVAPSPVVSTLGISWL